MFIYMYIYKCFLRHPGGRSGGTGSKPTEGEGAAAHLRVAPCYGLPPRALVVLLSLREKRGAGVAAVGALSPPAARSWLATAWPPPHRSVAARPARQLPLPASLAAAFYMLRSIVARCMLAGTVGCRTRCAFVTALPFGSLRRCSVAIFSSPLVGCCHNRRPPKVVASLASFIPWPLSVEEPIDWCGRSSSSSPSRGTARVHRSRTCRNPPAVTRVVNNNPPGRRA